jgi:tripartite-type tricarboxylate transporter receptor subunit TctC
MEMLLEPETMRRVEALGAIPVGSSAAELDAFLHAEATRWAEVVRRTGATAN